MAPDKQRILQLLDRLAPSQLEAVIRLLEIMTDPVARSIAGAPIEDEPISDEEVRAVEASKQWLKNHKPIPHEEVLAEFGLTLEDFKRMGLTPLDSQPADK